jgi:hypothetical protein
MHHHLTISDGALVITCLFFLAAAYLARYIHSSDK